MLNWGVKALHVCMRRLRCKIEADPEHLRYLHTIRNLGYRLSATAVAKE